MADPRECLPTVLQENSLFAETIAPKSRFDQLNKTDMFRTLSDEIIVLILNDLASTDVCNLRQSSKRVARMSSFHELPQSFWASRFDEDREMGFALALQSSPKLEGCTDWRRLYIAFRSYLRSSNEGAGIRNRKRIWHALSNISKPLSDLMNNEPVQQNHSMDSHQHSRCYTCGPLVSAEVMLEDQATEVLRIGSRRLRVDRLQWPQSDSLGQMMMGVSFTWFDGRPYVSGLRTWQPSCRGGRQSQRLGLIIPSKEQVMCFNPYLLRGFEVALTISGIVGIRILTNGIPGESTHATGDFSMTAPDVGIATLLLHSESQLFAIEVGLDV
jgi:hypothetical protein